MRPGRPGRAVAALALISLLGVSVTACGDQPGGSGSADTGAYCAALGADRAAFADMFASGSPGALIAQLPRLRELAAKAPSDLRDEWQAFLGPVERLHKALDAAGVEPDSFRDGRPPAGLDAASRQSIRAAADDLSSPATVSAAAGIDQQARDVCKINLGM